MTGTALYHVTRALVRIVLWMYFRKLEVAGAENVPRTGAVILAANHPQSITDALVLGAGSPRMLHYLAHSGLFRNRWIGWFLRQNGVLPVSRAQDAGGPERNAALFDACYEVMAGGGAIGIFPEGTSSEQPRLQPLRTGTARIALESEAQTDWRSNVAIVPVGINYESRRRFRSRVLLRFGEPIWVSGHRDAYRHDPAGAVHTLTASLGEALRRNVISIERAEYEELVGDLETVYKGDVLTRQNIDIPGDSKFQRDQWVSRQIPRALDHFLERDPELIWRVRRLLREYRRKRDRLHLKDETLRETRGTSVPGAAARFVVAGSLGLPFAAYGALWNVLPYRLTGWLADRVAPDATKVHYYRLTIGTAVYVSYYGVLLYVAHGSWGVAGTVIFALTLPPTGVFALAYAARMARRRDRIRLGFLELHHGFLVKEVRQTRSRLIHEIDAAAIEYLRAVEVES